jgi:hypothetical protein
MLWLKRVIARLLGTQTQLLDNPVQPTQTAGLAHQTPITKTGNKRSVVATKRPRQSLLAQPASPKKPKAAKSTTAASKGSNKKQEPVQTAKLQTTAGNSTRTVARQTPQAAKSAPKAKRSVAK